jgi:hypothetical protein
LKKIIVFLKVKRARMLKKIRGLSRMFPRLVGLLYVVLVFSLVVGAWIAWAKWGAQEALRYLCPANGDCQSLGQVGDLFGGVNALFAGLAFGGLVLTLEAARRQNSAQRQWEKDKELVDQIRSSYQWAYDSLSEFTRPNAEHTSVRLGWLVAARHLLRAEKLVTDIKTDVFKIIQQEHEEMWRSRIHALVSDTKNLPFQASVLRQTSIELRSALVIADFIVRGGEWADPIDEVDAHALFESESWKGSGLSRVIENYVARGNSGFLEKHLGLYPTGRIARQRDLFETGLNTVLRSPYSNKEGLGHPPEGKD